MKKVSEIVLKKGYSHWGSGGYSAGWRVIEGEVEATPIAGTKYRDSYIVSQKYLVRPISEVAVIYVHNYDCISSSGRRSLGYEGYVVLKKDDSKKVEVCPDCGHILRIE